MILPPNPQAQLSGSEDFMYENKIKNKRNQNDQALEISFESDRGRIINCSAVRRLQQRTQVFPLEEDATIRSRLTHSLEVQQTGRYIAREILKQAKDKNIVLFKIDDPDPDKLQIYRDAFISLVEMACLLHDIGNPPFGHFGEKAIQDWANENLDKIFEESIPNKSSVSFVERNMLLLDLKNFDGNAQGIRLVTSLQQLNLTYSQIASFLKYTRGAFEEGKMKKIDKKPGFFYSEKEIIEKIQKELNIDSHYRFPLVYIMEAADDICYSIADIDDALDKGIVKIEDFIKYLRGRIPNDIMARIDTLYKYSRDQTHNNPNAHFMINLRVNIQVNLVPEIARLYLEKHEEIFHGSLDQALLDLESSNWWFVLLEEMKRFTQDNIFSHRSIYKMEIKGYKIIHSLLEIFKPLLGLPLNVFKDEESFKSKYPFEYRLYKRLPAKYRISYLNTQQKYQENECLELYFRIRLIFDYISGMTDNFALKEYQTLLGIK